MADQQQKKNYFVPRTVIRLSNSQTPLETRSNSNSASQASQTSRPLLHQLPVANVVNIDALLGRKPVPPFISAKVATGNQEVFDNNNYYDQELQAFINLSEENVQQLYRQFDNEMNKQYYEYQRINKDFFGPWMVVKNTLRLDYNFMTDDNIFKILNRELTRLPIFYEIGIEEIKSLTFYSGMVRVNDEAIFAYYRQDKRITLVFETRLYNLMSYIPLASRQTIQQNLASQGIHIDPTIVFMRDSEPTLLSLRIRSIILFLLAKMPYTRIEFV